MNKELGRIIAMILIIVPILLSVLLNFKSDLLVPNGYDLAIDGFVISRTIVMMFTLYLLMKLGLFILTYTKKG